MYCYKKITWIHLQLYLFLEHLKQYFYVFVRHVLVSYNHSLNGIVRIGFLITIHGMSCFKHFLVL